MTQIERTRAGYDAIAAEYAEHFAGDDLSRRPIDRAFVAAFAELVVADSGPGARVVDVGSGPGDQTAFLQAAGLEPTGIDLSARMVEVARERHPQIEFEVGSMLALPQPDGSLPALSAMWSIIHVPDELLPTAIGEFARVLAPGGHALLIFQTDAETRHFDEVFGIPVDLDYLRHPVERVVGLLEAAGLRVHTRMRREPDDTMTAPHAFLLARKTR
ncbi:class I SAM-dependent methyltransferase [Cryptosporangium japonicum]|uniref:Class I SAM-dependent methyltransferase n=1 Tax=Cryptosporangium japonicum TaxID=80872 RepID=A0ABN0V372_9ACTN